MRLSCRVFPNISNARARKRRYLAHSGSAVRAESVISNISWLYIMSPVELEKQVAFEKNRVNARDYIYYRDFFVLYRRPVRTFHLLFSPYFFFLLLLNDDRTLHKNIKKERKKGHDVFISIVRDIEADSVGVL